MTYYIGQALGILAIAMTILMFQLKNKTHMLFVNIISNAAVAINVLFIKNEFNSGVIICLIAIVQIIVSHIHDKKGTEVPLIEKIIFLVLYIGGGLVGLTGPKEILPIIAAVFYMLAMFQKDPQKIRYILLGNMASWVIYFISPFSTSIFAQIAGIISSVIGILRYRKQKTEVQWNGWYNKYR